MRLLTTFLAIAGLAAAPSVASAQEVRAIVDASAPNNVSVTVYRDPLRGPSEEMNPDWPEGFAMISETRRVTLPAGQSTIRFEGVSEGMVAVSAIVTGLPGGTIEKNRNAELLSPAALVNGTLGNRVTITRTNPATGQSASESAIVRTRADGGLVLQTGAGFEAVRCAGIPEKLTFNRVPDGLSARPIYSVNTFSEAGGTYDVVLTYLSSGFDWQANYVGTVLEGEQAKLGKRGKDEFSMSLLSWLTLVNNNGQSFPNAELLVVAGTLNVESDFVGLADPPRATPLRLTCYPIGSTAAGSPLPRRAILSRRESSYEAEEMALMEAAAPIMVTASKRTSADVMTAAEENLGDLKLYRVPERVTVAAKGMKQVAFLNKQAVAVRYLYSQYCNPYRAAEERDEFDGADMLLVTKNDADKGLGVALPQGGLAVFEPSSRGPQLVADSELRDYAQGQDVELPIGTSAQVFTQCARVGEDFTDDGGRKWTQMRAEVTNANPHDILIRFQLGESGEWDIRFPGHKKRVKDGYVISEIRVPANGERVVEWKLRRPKGFES